jgi:hypothetical protein
MGIGAVEVQLLARYWRGRGAAAHPLVEDGLEFYLWIDKKSWKSPGSYDNACSARTVSDILL